MPGLTRRLPMSVRHRVVATKWGPAGTAWLYDRLDSKAQMLTGRSINAAEIVEGRVRLHLDGVHGVETIDTDTVVAGTGFRPEVDRLTMLSPKLRAMIALEGVSPKLDPAFETSVPNLHLLGILSAPTFGPVMRFMFGAKHAAPMVAKRIAARSVGMAKISPVGMSAAPARR
jgi:hypothetical protein